MTCRRMLKRNFAIPLGAFIFTYSSWAIAGYSSIQNFLENSFAATIVLSDSDVFTVGISDFDPNELLNTNNEDWGTEDSIDNRKKYAISTIPYTLSSAKQMRSISTASYYAYRVWFLKRQCSLFLMNRKTIFAR